MQIAQMQSQDNQDSDQSDHDNNNNTQVMSYMDALISNKSTLAYSPSITQVHPSLSNNVHHAPNKMQKYDKAKCQLHCKYIPIHTITSPMAPSKSNNQYTAVVDSGAGAHMTSAKELFTSLQMYYDKVPNATTPTVVMGDDTTTYHIKGHGTMDYMVQGRRIKQHGYYIPDLGNIVLISVKLHKNYKGCYFHSGNDGTVLAYPTFLLNCSTSPEIQFTISPTTRDHKQKPDFDYAQAQIHTPS